MSFGLNEYRTPHDVGFGYALNGTRQSPVPPADTVPPGTAPPAAAAGTAQSLPQISRSRPLPPAASAAGTAGNPKIASNDPPHPPARSSSFCCHCTGAAGDLSREGLVQDQAGAAGRPGFAGASGLRPLKPPSGRFGLRPLPPRQPSLCQQPLPSLPHRATGKGK